MKNLLIAIYLKNPCGANFHVMKILWYLQKKHAGGNGNLIINFAWPNWTNLISYLILFLFIYFILLCELHMRRLYTGGRGFTQLQTNTYNHCLLIKF